MELGKMFSYEQLLKSARYNDPTAMYLLAVGYDSGRFQDSSNKLYIFWLSKFFESDEVEKVINYFDDDSPTILAEEQAILGELIVDAGIRLGLLLKNSVDYSELKMAYDGVYAAYVVSKLSYIEVGDDSQSLQSLLVELHQKIKDFSKNYLSEHRGNVSISTGMPQHIWNAFQPSTHIEISTCEMCLRLLDEQTIDVDYSSAIIPIMKGLECELKKHLYVPYICYLRDNISPQRYFKELQHKYPNITRPKSLINLRRKILGGASIKDCFYEQNPDTQNLMIGEFKYAIGATSFGGNFSVDSAFLDFCKNKLFSGSNTGATEIQNWLKHLLMGLESLREIRNQSAHGYALQGKREAYSTVDELFLKNKLLLQIVSPSLNWD